MQRASRAVMAAIPAALGIFIAAVLFFHELPSDPN
jgi:hypothetical protein